MAGSIESITATIPCAGIQYCDLRPTITANTIDEYREQLAEVGRLAGNENFANRMLNPSNAEKAHTEPLRASERVCFGGTCLNFYEDTHQYIDDDGVEYTSATAFAKKFVKAFPIDAIAKKTAEKNGKDPEEVVNGWECKGDVSKLWGSAVHKALECKVKYGETINDQRLDLIASNFAERTSDLVKHMEVPVIDKRMKLCGRIDCLVQHEGKDCTIIDFKTGDIHKKISWTEEGKALGLKAEMLSEYQIQLSVYAKILSSNGYNVKGIEVWVLDGDDWKQTKLKVLENIWES